MKQDKKYNFEQFFHHIHFSIIFLICTNKIILQCLLTLNYSEYQNYPTSQAICSQFKTCAVYVFKIVVALCPTQLRQEMPEQQPNMSVYNE